MVPRWRRRLRFPLPRQLTAAFAVSVVGAACASGTTPTAATPTAPARAGVSVHDVTPAPVLVKPSETPYTITEATTIYTGSDKATGVAEQLAGILRPSTGYKLAIEQLEGEPKDGIVLLLSGADERVGEEGYELDVTGAAVVLRAQSPAGLFHGVQTLRQLLPPRVERSAVQPGPWPVAGGYVLDSPRFGYRGAMLDVARHFFTTDEVKRYIDYLALYKVNYLHLHLTDDQGWRIQIDSWPRLHEVGSRNAVGGGPGGYYTKDEYRELVAYAQARHITLVPEFDIPGHTNAALHSYAKLNCDGTAPPEYTGIEVGFSSLCLEKEITYEFVRDVLTELAELTPGPYLHIGGDEADTLTDEQYRTFMNRVYPMVRELGKIPVGWHQVQNSTMDAGVLQYWGTEPTAPEVVDAVGRGNQLLMSPADKAYLDMKYTEDTELGLQWAGLTTVRDAYDWDPATRLPGVGEPDLLGVEAPLWSETLVDLDDIEFMAFPRLPAIAEIAWSTTETHDWAAFRERLAAQGPRWEALGIDFYRSPQVDWPEAP